MAEEALRRRLKTRENSTETLPLMGGRAATGRVSFPFLVI